MFLVSKKSYTKMISLILVFTLAFPLGMFSRSVEAKTSTFNINAGKTKVIGISVSEKKAKVTWKLSNKKIAKIIKKTAKGNIRSVKIKGLKAGKTILKATYKSKGKVVTKKCTIIVKDTKKADASSVTPAPQQNQPSIIQNNYYVVVQTPNPVVPVNNVEDNTAAEQPTNAPLITEAPTAPPTATAAPTPYIVELKQTEEILRYNFDAGQNNSDFMNNGVSLQVDSHNSNAGVEYGETVEGNACIKVTNRANGRGWWERRGACFDLKKLNPGKYLISVDVMHQNDAVESKGYGEFRAFKMGVYYEIPDSVWTANNRDDETHQAEVDERNEAIIARNQEIEERNMMKADGEGLEPLEKLEVYNSPHTSKYGQIGVLKGASKGDWERLEGEITIKEDVFERSEDYFLYVFMGYPEVAGERGNVSYQDQNSEDYYIDNFTIKKYIDPIYVSVTPKPNKPAPTPWQYTDSKTIYKQHYDVTRWYNPDITGEINGHKHDGYKNNTFAIWMVGFYDNPYSTNEEEINTTYGPELQYYKGKEINVSGKISYEGTRQRSIMLQLTYTSPDDYPILYKWENGSNGLDTKYSSSLKIKDNTGGSGGALDPDTNGNLDINFTIPTNAKNGDRDEYGRPYGIYLYFPNKPGGALTYLKDNTFHFKDFLIKKR